MPRKTITVEVNDIDWDVDEYEELTDIKEILPKDCTLQMPDEYETDTTEFNDLVADTLSNEYGYTVNGFTVSRK